jgi:Flp pilus assembly protein TadD
VLGVRRITGCAWLAAALALAAGAGPARADDKKNRGLLDDFSGGWKLPVTREREAAARLAPGGFDLSPVEPGSGPPRPIRLRLYADSDYRTMPHWQSKVRSQIDRINHVVGPVFNVRFEIESVREWDRSHSGVPFETMLAELDALDTGQEVDWVIGLVTPFRGVATSMHQVGGARLLSRAFVLRAMDDEQEALALNRSFGMLSPGERETLYGQRKAHKEIVVFLHEWGHTMGALHDEDPSVIMNPAYDPRATGFSEFEKQLFALVIDHRLSHREEPFPESKDVVPLLEGSPPAEGSDKERAALLALARARGGGGGGRASAGGARLDIPSADVAAYNQAVVALNAGRADDAWASLEPVARRHPRQGQVLALACALVTAPAHAADARVACDRAIELSPDDSRPRLDAAAAYVRAGDLERATPLVLAATSRPRAAPARAGEPLRLARLALAVGALTAADAILAAEDGGRDDVKKELSDVEVARRRLALPRDSARWGVSPEKEPAYVAAWENVRRARPSDAGRARSLAREFAAAFPEAPGSDVLACEAELRAGRAAAASKRCEAALAKYDEAVMAHYLLGSVAARTRNEAVAVKHLRRAILLDPRDPNPWRELARFFRATGSSQRLSELRAEHQALLSEPLPE